MTNPTLEGNPMDTACSPGSAGDTGTPLTAEASAAGRRRTAIGDALRVLLHQWGEEASTRGDVSQYRSSAADLPGRRVAFMGIVDLDEVAVAVDRALVAAGALGR